MKNFLRASFLMTMVVGHTCSVLAQSREMYERLLVPIVIDGEVPGGFGSRWTTQIVGHNASNARVQVAQDVGGCALGVCPTDTAEPNTTFTYLNGSFLLPTSLAGTGSFLHVARPHNASVTFNLRVQDISRQALTWGTELPVVRESEAFVDPLQLLNIPTDSRFRVAVRVYDFEPENTAHHVRLRVYGATKQLIAETMVALVSFDRRLLPGYAQFTDLVATFPQLASSETVRVEITPITRGLRFWAFASVTNNETQHVTTVTPQ